MSKHDNFLDEVIGQARAKRQLSFYLKNHRTNRTPFPHLLFTGSQGDGKSFLARKVAKNLPDFSDGSRTHKAFFSLNATAIKNNKVFFEDICSQFADSDTYCTVFIDESHELPRKVQGSLLNVLEPTATNQTSFEYDGVTYFFDFEKVTFIFATTEDDKMFPPLVDRIKPISLEPYGPEDLAEIIKLRVGGEMEFEDGVLETLSHHVRRNGRKADEIGKDILSFGVPVFRKKHFKELAEKTNLFLHGLSIDEVRLLEILEESGELSLGQLASRIGRPTKAVQKGIEPYILALSLMEIDGKRRITARGRDYLRVLKGKPPLTKQTK